MGPSRSLRSGSDNRTAGLGITLALSEIYANAALRRLISRIPVESRPAIWEFSAKAHRH